MRMDAPMFLFDKFKRINHNYHHVNSYSWKCVSSNGYQKDNIEVDGVSR